MIVTIAIAVGSALLHWLLQKQAVKRYEECMKEAVRAAKHAQSADVRSLQTQDMVQTTVVNHINALQPLIAALPKKRAPRKTKSAGIGEPEQSA